MADTNAELASITRTLNTVTTAGQARSAIGCALVALHSTYEVAKTIDTGLAISLAGDSARRDAAFKELDQARLALERWYGQIVPTGQADFRTEWSKHRNLVSRAYVVIAGVEGVANYRPTVSHWEILRESIKEGIGNVKEFLHEAVQQTTDLAAGGIWAVLWGFIKGLGFGGVVLLILIGVVALAYFKRATIVGQLGGAVGGAVRKVVGG